VFFLDSISLLLCGIGVGWLIGQSLSPVVNTVITSIVVLVASIVGTLSGIKTVPERQTKGEIKKDNNNHWLKNFTTISPLPLAILVTGLVAGSCLGIYARTNEWLSPNPQQFAQKWNDIGLADKDIKRRLFDTLYPLTPLSDIPSKNEKQTQATPRHLAAALYGVSSDDCSLLQTKHGKELRARLKALNNKRINSALEKCNNDSCLESIKELVCSNTK
jgi:hypothetical protein